jgi:hypothetical protein
MTVIGEKIIGTTREIANEIPDFIYRSDGLLKACAYVEYNEDGESKPGCIFGHALLRLGMIDLSIAEWDANTEGIRSLAYREDWALSNPELDWMGKVQNEQDTGSTWAEAVALADRLYKVVA